MRIAFISCQSPGSYLHGTLYDEDETLLKFLSNKGIKVERAIWNDPTVNWELYDVALLKSPWDYHEHFSDFSAWLNNLQSAGVRLLNPYRIIRWNMDKHYLQEIGNSGLPVIPSVFLERHTKPELHEFFEKLKTRRIVIKPCIGAGARNTLTVTPENMKDRQRQLHVFLQEASFLVQPFMEEIFDGELSFIFLGGRYSHCVLKRPESNDFRVQHYHGGTTQIHDPEKEHIASALRYVDKYARGCLYARVDGLLIKGRFKLMELELTEPYLFLEQHPEGYDHYYKALMEFIPECQ